MDAVGCHTCFSVLISVSVFNVFHIPSNGCTQILYWVHYIGCSWVHYIGCSLVHYIGRSWVHYIGCITLGALHWVQLGALHWVQLGALHPFAPPTPGYDPASEDRFLTQLSGQLNALFALSPEKDTPGSFYIEIELWRRAVSSPRAPSIPVGHGLHVEVQVWTSRKYRGCYLVDCVL